MKKSLLILVLILAAHSEAIGQWVQTNGPYGGDILAMAASGNDLFVALSGNGIYMSSNNGSSWAPANSGLPANFSITKIVVDNGNLIIPYGGIYVSSDNGSNWIEKPSGLFEASFGLLAANGSCLVACTISDDPGSTIYLSTNMGDSWVASDSGLNNAAVLYLGSCGKNFIAGTDNTYGGIGAYISTDSGRYWFPDTVGLGKSMVQSIVMNGTSTFVGTEDGGIFKSTDSGVSWINVTTNYGWLIASNDSMLFATGNQGVVQSSDQGASWNSLGNASQFNQEITCLAAIGETVFLGTTWAGVFRLTIPDSNWVGTSNGLICSPIDFVRASGNSLFASVSGNYHGTLFRSTDDGTTWTVPDSSLTAGVGNFGSFGSDLFVANANDVFRSTDDGASWKKAEYGLGVEGGAFTFTVIDSNMYAGTDFGIFYWTDSTSAWTQIRGLGDDVNALAWSDSTFFAGTSDGLFIGNDNGTQWSSGDNGLPSRSFITSLGVIDSTIFLGTFDGGMFYSKDNGRSWEILTTQQYTTATILAISGQNLIASFGNNVYLTISDGALWTPINDGLPISSLAISGKYLFAGVGSQGVWRCPLSAFGISTVSAVNPLSNSITAFPNPLTQSTTIRFISPEIGVARVTVVNLLGQEVARVFEGALTVGEHSFVWGKPTGLPNGMYECVVEMNGSVQQVPIIVEP